MINWLYQTTIELSLLIILVLILRKFFQRLFGAQIAYFLWLIPLISIFFERPQRPLELMTLPNTVLQTELYDTTATIITANEFPWEWLWFIGSFLWAVILISKIIRFKHLLSNTTKKANLQEINLKGVLNKFWIEPKQVLMTSLPGAPFVTGLLNPKLLLPDDFSERFSPQEQCWILTHELTHLKRRDLMAKVVIECLRCLFWFNPLVQIAAYFVEQDQELACDQEVISSCDRQERYQYGLTLLKGSGLKNHPAFIGFFGCSLFNNHKERFVMLEKHKKSTLNTILGLACCALIASCSLTSAPAVEILGDINELVEHGYIVFDVSQQGEISIDEFVINGQSLASGIEQRINERPNAGIVIRSNEGLVIPTSFDPAIRSEITSTNPTYLAVISIVDAAREAGVSNIQLRSQSITQLK